MSLTSINNFFFFREKSVSCSSSLSVCLHTFTCALWFSFFDFWLYLNCKYQSQSSINHSPFPLLSTPAHKSIKRRLAPVTIFTTIRGRGELRWGGTRSDMWVKVSIWRQQQQQQAKPHQRNLRYSLFAHGNTCSTLFHFIIFFVWFSVCFRVRFLVDPHSGAGCVRALQIVLCDND